MLDIFSCLMEVDEIIFGKKFGNYAHGTSFFAQNNVVTGS
jgi:hypothetical protein